MAHTKSTLVEVLTDVPLDSKYEHTIFFTNAAAQYGYFHSKMKYTFDNQSFVRINENTIRVSRVATELYNCNYLIIKNTSYDATKYYYAFIIECRYINDNVTEIIFSLDVMQTWAFDYKLLKCFVEREHTVTDHWFEHIEDENLDLGDEYVLNYIDTTDENQNTTRNYCAYEYNFSVNKQLIILANYTLTKQSTIDDYLSRLSQADRDKFYSKSKIINGVYCPCTIFSVPMIKSGEPATYDNFYTVVSDILNMLQETEIICVYQGCTEFGLANQTDVYHTTIKDTAITLDSIDGYKPNNKKLFCYPYNVLNVTNTMGEMATYKFEDWDKVSDQTAPLTHIGSFTVFGINYTMPTAMLFPLRYRNSGGYPDYTSGLSFSMFPQCAWAGDAFKAWWAQHAASYLTSLSTNIVGSVVGAGGDFMSGVASSSGSAGYAGLAVGVAQGAFRLSSAISSECSRYHDLKMMPSQTYGQARSGYLLYGIDKNRFLMRQECIKYQYAKMIDDYFSMFGYKCRKLKIPNRVARPYWTYTKTIGCKIEGINSTTSPPTKDCVKIENIFDNGITFWKYDINDEHFAVGDYSRNNNVN